MRRIRVIPVLLLKQNGLVKTVKFKKPVYIGDPINAVKIFNEKEVDELIILDISATPEKRDPSYRKIAEIGSECFMPFGYGGGINEISQIKKILNAGAEKVVINSAAVNHPSLISEAARLFGSQSIVGSIDVKRDFLGKYKVFIHCGSRKINKDPVSYAKELENLGAGEIFLNSIDRDGTMLGYDLPLIESVSKAVNIPIIVCGGARNVDDFVLAVKEGGASAVAAGSIFVFHGRERGILINFPSQDELTEKLY